MSVGNRNLIYAIGISYIFSVILRFIWLYYFSSSDQFIFNNELMINTNDGYHFANRAKDILSGASYSNIPPLSIVTSIFTTILPFPLDKIILLLSAFLSSLIVIPILLIANSINRLEVGFLAALIASIAWSYYNRTMTGYYDTDMLNVVFPMFVLWSCILALKTNGDKYILANVIGILLYKWWYPQSYSLTFAILGMIVLYGIYLFIKKQDHKYIVTFAIFYALTIINLEYTYSLPLLVVLFVFYKFKTELFHKFIYYILACAFVLFLIFGGFDPIWHQLKGYVFSSGTLSISDNKELNLHFFSVMQTVREAGKIPFDTFANRISGDVSIFVVSSLAYLFLLYKKPIMLLSLPLVGLGFMAYVGGLRFTVYAVPIMAFSIAFLIYEISLFLKNKSYRVSLITILTLGVLYPNIKHIISYKIPTVFNKNEVSPLVQLKQKIKPDDFIVSWWDYGYPLKYYTEANILIDGAKHGGADNFPVSYILTEHQEKAAYMSRLNVEYFAIKSNPKTTYPDFVISKMITDYGYTDANEFLGDLSSVMELPKKTRDVYIHLPFRMLNIYPTVLKFSNLNLMSGEKYASPFFYKSNTINEGKEFIDFGNGIKLRKTGAKLILNNKEISIKRFVKTKYDRKGHLQKQYQVVDKNSRFNIIFMADYKTVLIIEDKVYNSLYFQLFVLENYDKQLYEPVVISPMVKIFKLLI